MISELKERHATRAIAMLPQPGANGEKPLGQIEARISFRQNITAIRKRLRMTYPRPVLTDVHRHGHRL
jgi:hypothetical protein